MRGVLKVQALYFLALITFFLGTPFANAAGKNTVDCKDSGKDYRSIDVTELLSRQTEYLKRNRQGTQPDFSYVDLSNKTLPPHADLRYANLFHAKLINTELPNAKLDGAVLDCAVFFNADLRHAKGYDSFFRKADLLKSKLQDAEFFQAEMQGADFSNSKLKGADFTGAKMQGCIFCDTELEGAILRGADIKGAVFQPKTIPKPEDIAGLLNLSTVRLDPREPNPVPLSKLEASLWKSGAKKLARQARAALLLEDERGLWKNVTGFNLQTLRSVSFICMRTIFIALPTKYGMDKQRPLAIIFLIWICCSLVYFLLLWNRTGPGFTSGLGTISKVNPAADGAEPSRPIKLNLKIGSAIRHALWFSLLTTISLFIIKFAINRMLEQLQNRPFILIADGKVRIFSGFQAAVCGVLFGAWIWAEFGQILI